MIINIIKRKNYEYIIVDNFYNQDELIDIKNEIEYLSKFKKSPKYTETAKKDNTYIKKGDALWVDDFFIDRTQSKILTLNRKIFIDDIYKKAMESNLYFKNINDCNSDCTLLNFYENNDEYQLHSDQSLITALTMFKIGDFTGGNFNLIDETIEFKENRLIMFAGCLLHQAKPIIAEPNNYRITMAQFLNYKV
jgi:hypothetical protein